MKKPLLRLFAALLLGLVFSPALKAQYFSQVSFSDTIDNTPDTLHFFITGAQPGAYGNATVKITYSGDFGDGGENITIYGPDGTSVGAAGPYPSQTDCDGDATVSALVTGSLLNTWIAANDTLFFTGITSDQVGQFCSEQHAFIELSYNYCLQGRPAAISNSVFTFCNYDGAVALVGTPATGTFSGTGVTGSSFNPQAVAPGTYTITYSASDSGCVSSASVNFKVSRAPLLSDTTVCPNSAVTLSLAGGNGLYGWYSANGFTQLLDTGRTFTTAPINATTSFNVTALTTADTFTILTITGSDSNFVDHDALSGDDRGGVVATPRYAYVVGDDYTARYNLDLDPASGVSLPIRDGIFTNLANGELYSLSNGVDEFDRYSVTDVTMAIRMDSDLAYTADTIFFSQPIKVSDYNNYSGVFSGYNNLIIYSGETSRWYVVNLNDGIVQDLGGLADPEFLGSENWAVWGIAEFDGQNYSVIFGSSIADDSLYRRVLPASPATVFARFTDLGQTASLCYLPSLNRWYLHTEYESQFNPDTGSETLAYADATAVYHSGFAPLGNCPADITVSVKLVPSLGTDVAFCAGDSTTLDAGAGFTSYTWNGVATNSPTFVVKQQGNVAIAVVDSSNCTILDTIAVTVNPLPVITFALPFDTVCLGTSAITLTGATPAGGTFSGPGVTGSSLNPAALLAGPIQLTYTYTDSNTCSNSASDNFRAADCTVGINDLDENALLSIYPNPSNGNFTIQLNSVSATALNMVITDLTGKQVYGYQTTQAEPVMQLNLSALQDGMYMINATMGKLSFKQRLVIQK